MSAGSCRLGWSATGSAMPSELHTPSLSRSSTNARTAISNAARASAHTRESAQQPKCRAAGTGCVRVEIRTYKATIAAPRGGTVSLHERIIRTPQAPA